MSKVKLGIIFTLILILVIAIMIWLKPQNTLLNQPQNHQQSKLDLPDQSQYAKSQISEKHSQSFSSASQQDTQINCQIRVDGANRLIVNEQTKDCFEYFITQYGEKTFEQIKTDFLAYIKISYKEPVLSQLSDLWSRYMQYRKQLGQLPPPTTSKEDAKYYREILKNIQNLRKKFFSDYEIQGLFGTQNTYDQYTVDRMEILDNKNLSPTEKAEKLKNLFSQLPEDWQENLKQLNQLEDLRKLTAEIKSRNGTAEEIHQMRTNLVGAAATQRLETLDTQRAEWKHRVNQYLTERESIMKSSMSDSAKQSAVNQLRSQQFNNPQEQTRLQTFESVHDQGGKLPFSD